VWDGVAWNSATANTISLTGQVIVADAAARDVLYPSPVQGNAVFRNDLGVEETYYGLYNASTNPGGRDTAGWYSAGKILQVVEASSVAAISNSTTSYVDSGLAATITPKFATSKILVFIVQGYNKSAINSGNAVNIKILRDSTTINTSINHFVTSTTMAFRGVITLNIVDTPATTSPVTYKTQFANNVAASQVQCGLPVDAPQTIILMEVAQ